MMEPQQYATSYTRHEIESTLKDVIISVLRLDTEPSAIGSTTNIFDLGGDSMAVVELLLALEERFELRFDENELKSSVLENVGTIVEFLSNKIEQK